MCDVCVPFGDLTDEQLEQQTTALAADFTGLPMVIGAPMLLGEESWREVARHQLELGRRACADIPAIKTYVAPTPEQALDARTAAGRWVYVADHADIETPRERLQRQAREQREQWLAAVAERKAAQQPKKRPPRKKKH